MLGFIYGALMAIVIVGCTIVNNNLPPVHTIKLGSPSQLFHHFMAVRDPNLPTTDIQKIFQDIVHQQKRLLHSVEKGLGMSSERLHDTDLEYRFNVRSISDNKFPPHIEESIQTHGFKDTFDRREVFRGVSARLLRNKDLMKQVLGRHDSLTPDRRFYTKWIDPSIGYGVFTTVHIEPWTVLDVYAGQLRCGPTLSVNYAWRYMHLKEGNQACAINANNAGNIMRFVNDAGDNSTISITLGEYQHRFYWLYVSRRHIGSNQQVSIPYGDDYWDKIAIPYQSGV